MYIYRRGWWNGPGLPVLYIHREREIERYIDRYMYMHRCGWWNGPGLPVLYIHRERERERDR